MITSVTTDKETVGKMGEYEIELKRLEIRSKELEIEDRKAQLHQSLFKKNLSLIITSVISIAALFISASQVWVANISKEKESQVAKNELEIAKLQKEKEFDIEQTKQAQEWNIKLATFISENSAFVFSDKEIDRKRMKELILATFPSEKATDVFNRLAGIVTSPEAKNSWNEAGNTANNMSSQLVKDMFSDNKTTRLTATTKLFREGSSGNPALVPIIIDYATGNPSNKSGVINSLVVLQNVDPELLRANREQIDSLFNTVKENGDQTTEHIQKLKSLMD